MGCNGKYKQSPTLIAAALLLLATATHGQLLNNSIISGKICCTSSGNCPPGSVGVPGVRARLNCTTISDGVVTLGQGVTGPTGLLTLRLNNILRLLGPIVTGLLQFHALPHPQHRHRRPCRCSHACQHLCESGARPRWKSNYSGVRP